MGEIYFLTLEAILVSRNSEIILIGLSLPRVIQLIISSLLQNTSYDKEEGYEN